MKRRERNYLFSKSEIQRELVHYNVFRLKEDANLSNVEFANILGFSLATISAWENMTRGITLKALFMVAEALNVEMTEFYKPKHEVYVDKNDLREAKFKKIKSLLCDYSILELDCFIETIKSIQTLTDMKKC